jgi:uncharacterized protein (DUF433 family)
MKQNEAKIKPKIKPMDWSECSLAETRLGVQGGRPVLKGTRMPVDDIVHWEAGEDELEIAANIRLPVDQVKAVLEYAEIPPAAKLRRLDP